MKYLNHFNKHLGVKKCKWHSWKGNHLPYSERECGNSDADVFFFFFFLIAILANLL